MEDEREMDIMSLISDMANPKRRKIDKKKFGEGNIEVGILAIPDERDSFANLVLHEETINDIDLALRAIHLRKQMEQLWNIQLIAPQQGRCIINMFGPSGTGKTRASVAIARKLGKNLYQIDYSTIISKYLGDTAKHIVHAFSRARDLDCILFFDEADSLLSARIDMDHPCATSINQNRNTLMQELDRFDGVVIMTTNMFQNFDRAMLRRIARHIHFQLPNSEMRKRLFELHLPNMDRVKASLGNAAAQSDGLSGGDILNICLSAIYAASAHKDTAKWIVTDEHLMAEIMKVKAVNTEHAKGKRHGQDHS